MWKWTLFALVLGVAGVSCSPKDPASGGSSASSNGVASKTQNATLAGGIVARVGASSIPASMVAEVASAQNLTPRQALDALVDDALLAEGARAENLQTRRSIEVELVAARARLVAKRIRQDAQDQGPALDSEVAELSRMHWQKYDHPEEVRVIHAVVLGPKKPDVQLENRAKDLAGQVARAVAGAKDEDDFEARAEAVPHDGMDIRVERLPPFIEDGTVAEGGGAMDSTFSRAAFPLHVGETSGVVETPFGWHVIRVVERVPAYTAPMEERRAAFTAEARQIRADRALKEILQRQRAAVHLESASAVDAMLRETKLP